MKKVLLLIIAMSFGCGQALAITVMGPPTATLERGQFAIVPEYSYSETDIEKERRGIDDVTLNLLLLRIAYGFRDDVELYVRGGTGGGSQWIPITLGAGVRCTFTEYAGIPLGVLFQAQWLPGTEFFAGDLDLYEIQIAAGPTYRVDRFYLYGGPFLHFLRGEGENNFFNTDYDVHEESVFGAYVGVGAELTEHLGVHVELQATGGAYGFGPGLPWNF